MDLGKLNVQADDVEDWFDRFDLYCCTNDKITDINKTAFLLTMAGGEAYKLIKNLGFPKQPKDLQVSEIRKILSEHLRPMRFETTERAKFHSMIRSEGQDMKDFILSLQAQASLCNFGDQLEIQLRDRIVAGINNPEVQKKLLLIPSLSFSKAKTTCLSFASVDRAVDVNPTCLLSQKRSHQYSKTRNHTQANDNRRQNVRSNIKCHSCGGAHLRNSCKFREAKCFQCNKVGHIKKVCRQSVTAQLTEISNRSEVLEVDTTDVTVLHTNNKYSNHLSKVYQVKTDAGISDVDIIQDTGSPVSFMSKAVLDSLFRRSAMRPTKTVISGVTGHELNILGETDLQMSLNQSDFTTITFLVAEQSPTVIGLSDLRKFNSTLALTISTESKIDSKTAELVSECSKLRGGMKIDPVHLEIEASPVFCKSRAVPHGLREPVRAALQKLQADSIISPIGSSQWATPIVTPIKSDGNVRICGDYKVSVNSHLLKKASTTCEPETLFIQLKDKKYFSKIDLENAFLQIPLDEESQKLTTINTPFGLYSFKCLPFGLSVSPGIFQETIDHVIQGLTGVVAYQDDLLVFADSHSEHDERLQKLLWRLKNFNVRINAKKSVFKVNEISYLGYRISSSGISPDPDRLRPLLKASTPKSQDELRSLLGCFQYYSKFLPNFATRAAPLFGLLSRSAKEVTLTGGQLEVIEDLKRELASLPKLQPFSLTTKSVVIVDASEKGIGAVLEQDGFPVICVSRKLSKSETSYSQTQKEALAIVWGVTRLHKFLFNTKFSIFTDHRSLQYIFDPNASLAKGTSNMLQRWAIFLSGYDYDIVHRNGKDIPQADYLSRYPCLESEANSCLFIQPLPISRSKLVQETQKVYGSIVASIKRGWTSSVKKRFREFFVKRDELSLTVDGVLCWKELSVIPPTLRKEVLEFLHIGHLGKEKMKSVARLSVWWPGINNDISQFCFECTQCRTTKPVNSSFLSSWPCTFQPWQRIHMDYCGPFLQNYHALVVIDSYSKWPEVFLTKSANADFTMKALRKCFSREGSPSVIVSDNGTHFTADSIQSWLKSISTRQVFTPPRHPQSNGLAENFVKSLKTAIRTVAPTTFDELERCIDNFLLFYRNARHTTTNEAPSKLFKGRHLRCLPMDQAEITFWRGVDNRVRDGIVLNKLGSNTFNVLDLEDGSVHRRHRDQLRIGLSGDSSGGEATPEIVDQASGQVADSENELRETASTRETPESVPVRVSGRIRRRPRYLEEFQC